MVTEIKDMENLQTKLNEVGDQLVIVDFFATWCGACRSIAPRFEGLAAEYTNVHFCKVDVDESEDLAKEYNISAMPTFIFFKNKEIVFKFSGSNSAKLKEKILENI